MYVLAVHKMTNVVISFKAYTVHSMMLYNNWHGNNTLPTCGLVTHCTRKNVDKYVRLRGLTYIHTCRSYTHTPRELDKHVVESRTGTLIVLHTLIDSSDFGRMGSSSPKWEIPCPGRR